MRKRFRSGISLALAVLLLTAIFIGAASTAYADGEITKVTVRTDPNRMPYVAESAAGYSAVVSSSGCSVASVGWYLDGAPVYGNFEPKTYTLMITVVSNGEPFAANAAGYINNEPSMVSRSEDGMTLTLSRYIVVSTWLCPSIWKNPGDETVTDDHPFASFVASASPCYTDMQWYIVTPDERTYNISEIATVFPGTTYDRDDATGRMNIYSVTPEMDRCRVYCTFANPGASARTNAAYINVKTTAAQRKNEPAPTETPAPAEQPAAQDPTAEAAANEPAEAHTHSYGDVWMNDDRNHWKECECGAIGEEGSHSMAWTVTREATAAAEGEENGVCSECGYTANRAIPKTAPAAAKQESSRNYVLIVLVILAIIAFICYCVRVQKEKKRRRKRGIRTHVKYR